MKEFTSDVIKKKIEKKKKMNKIFKYALYPVFIFIAICAIDILYQIAIEKEKDINILGYKPYIVLSGSMEPKLQIGDLVISKKIKKENIKIGDIITFEDENKSVITHRIIDTIVKDGKTFYQTKGDNNNTKDIGLVSFKNIKGKYVFKISKLGRVITTIMTPNGIIIVVLIMTTMYITTSKKNDRKIARHSIRERYKKIE